MSQVEGYCPHLLLLLPLALSSLPWVQTSPNLCNPFPSQCTLAQPRLKSYVQSAHHNIRKIESYWRVSKGGTHSWRRV